MTRQPASTDRLEAVKRCFEAYGADPARWPEKERAAYGAFADADETAQARAEAETLDGFLGAATAPPPAPDALKARIIAQYQSLEPRLSERRGALSAISAGLMRFFDQRALLPAGALAGVAGLGVFVGALTAQPGVSLTPEAEVYAYIEDAMTLSLLGMEENVE